MLDNLPNTGHAGFAGKAEFLLAGAEFTVGGYFEQDAVSAAMVTYSGSVWGVDLFAEAVAQYGSTITVVEEDGPLLVTNDRADQWFPLATTGFRYSWSDDVGNFNLNLLGQYYFNGQGYEDPSILAEPGVLALLGSGQLSFKDFQNTGRHYGAVSLSWNGAFGSDFSPSAFWIGNLSDQSGRLAVDLRYRLNDYISFSPGYSYVYGEDTDEYSRGRAGHLLTLTANLGAGRF
jgi:hypothetical protein